MAFTRKMLKALGIEEEKIDEIMDAHTEVTEALKAQRDEYKVDAEKLPNVQRELDSLKSKGDDGWESKYNAEHEAFEKFKTAQAEKETKAAKSKAFENLLKSVGISEKRISAIMKVTDLDSVEVDNDGKIKDIEKHTETIKSEWGDFIETQRKDGTKVQNPPDGSDGGITKEQFNKMSYNERVKLFNENKELYDKLKE